MNCWRNAVLRPKQGLLVSQRYLQKGQQKGGQREKNSRHQEECRGLRTQGRGNGLFVDRSRTFGYLFRFTPFYNIPYNFLLYIISFCHVSFKLLHFYISLIVALWAYESLWPLSFQHTFLNCRLISSGFHFSFSHIHIQQVHIQQVHIQQITIRLWRLLALLLARIWKKILSLEASWKTKECAAFICFAPRTAMHTGLQGGDCNKERSLPRTS